MKIFSNANHALKNRCLNVYSNFQPFTFYLTFFELDITFIKVYTNFYHLNFLMSATGERVADIAYLKAELNTEINLMEQEMVNLEVSYNAFLLCMPFYYIHGLSC